MVRECAGEVIRAELVGGDERVLDQELRPLVEQAKLECQESVTRARWMGKEWRWAYVVLDERGVFRLLGVAECHDDHVAALCVEWR